MEATYDTTPSSTRIAHNKTFCQKDNVVFSNKYLIPFPIYLEKLLETAYVHENVYLSAYISSPSANFPFSRNQKPPFLLSCAKSGEGRKKKNSEFDKQEKEEALQVFSLPFYLPPSPPSVCERRRRNCTPLFFGEKNGKEKKGERVRLIVCAIVIIASSLRPTRHRQRPREQWRRLLRYMVVVGKHTGARSLSLSFLSSNRPPPPLKCPIMAEAGGSGRAGGFTNIYCTYYLYRKGAVHVAHL